MKLFFCLGLVTSIMSLNSLAQEDTRCLVEVVGSNPTDSALVKVFEKKGYRVQNLPVNQVLQISQALRTNTPESIASVEGRAITYPILLSAGCMTETTIINNRRSEKIKCQGSQRIRFAAVYGGEVFSLGNNNLGQSFRHPANAVYTSTDQVAAYLASQFEAVIPSCNDLKKKKVEPLDQSINDGDRSNIDKSSEASESHSSSPHSATPQ